MTYANLSAKAGIPLKYANRHGLITGATGTGKTVSLMRLAESFSMQGVPVFAADVKGDLSALARTCPAQLLDVYGRDGAPLRVSVSSFGADLFARALELSEVQAGCLEIAFAYANARGLPLDTLQDLRAICGAMVADRQAVSAQFGLVTPASVGAIQRAVLRLETQGASSFFGAPCFDIATLLDIEPGGPGPEGVVSILAGERLLHAPRLYSALLLWLLRELFQRLPEIGDMSKPRLVFIFDEAHTIFSDCPAALLRSIEQTARLIRSKGVGIYFASQSPADLPEIIRNQCATRIQHDRALGVGRAHFDTLDNNGAPSARQLIQPILPSCALGALSDEERARFIPAVAEILPTASHAPRVRVGLILSLFAAFVACLVAFFLSPSVWLAVLALALIGALNLIPYPE